MRDRTQGKYVSHDTSAFDALIAALPAGAEDVVESLQAVLLRGSSLDSAQRWGIALAAAYAARAPRLARLVRAEVERLAGPDMVDDARAAALAMAMTNVYYRFRGAVTRATYETRHARLCTKRLARPRTRPLDVTLFALAVSAIHGCGDCMRHHERLAVAGGLSEDQVNDAVRIAATIHAAAVALELDT